MIIVCKTVIRTFRCIYVNCFNRLGFLVEVSTKLQILQFFGQFKDHNFGRKHENQIIFFFYFFCSVCNIIFIIESGQNFSCRPPFGLFWSVKYLNFGRKLPIGTAHRTFLKSRHPEVTKNPYYVFSSKGTRKRVQAHALIPVYRGAYIPYFKIHPPIFFCPLFSENYLKPKVRISKMINKNIVDYHPSPSQLISMIHTLIYLWTLRGLSLQNLS